MIKVHDGNVAWYGWKQGYCRLAKFTKFGENYSKTPRMYMITL
jgi:hypothetical protein